MESSEGKNLSEVNVIKANRQLETSLKGKKKKKSSEMCLSYWRLQMKA